MDIGCFADHGAAMTDRDREDGSDRREPTPPPYLLEIAIEARAEADAQKLESALWSSLRGTHLCVRRGRRPLQVLLRGSDELEMQRVIGRAREAFKLDVTVGAPQVACRETISRAADVDYRYRGLMGWLPVRIHVEPLAAGAGLALEMRWSNVAEYDADQAAGLAKGVIGALEHGVVGGFPVVDLKVIWTRKRYDLPIEEAAAFAAMQVALTQAAPRLLEPVMRVEVATPGDCMAQIVEDLKTRGGRITAQDEGEDERVITALVPLAKLLGYARSLAALSWRRATVAMAFSHYEPGPPVEGGDSPFRTAMAMRARRA
jgi:elongation factor G